MVNIVLSDSWCQFVLNEGIMPSAIARRIKHDENDRQNPKFIASILLQRKNFSDTTHSEIASLARTSFLNDPELTNWLAKTDTLLNVIIQFSDQQGVNQVNATDLLNGAYTSFIKSCPLVAEETKNKYQKTTEKNTTRVSQKRSLFFRRENDAKKQAFTDYLIKKMYRLNTCNAYKSAVSNWGSTILKTNLWDIDDPLEMKRKFDEYCETPEFIDKDYSTHKTLSNGLLKYIEFLKDVNM